MGGKDENCTESVVVGGSTTCNRPTSVPAKVCLLSWKRRGVGGGERIGAIVQKGGGEPEKKRFFGLAIGLLAEKQEKRTRYKREEEEEAAEKKSKIPLSFFLLFLPMGREGETQSRSGGGGEGGGGCKSRQGRRRGNFFPFSSSLLFLLSPFYFSPFHSLGCLRAPPTKQGGQKQEKKAKNSLEAF